MYRMVHFYYSVLSVEDDVVMPAIPDVSNQLVVQAVNVFFDVMGEDKRNYSNRWVGSRYQEGNPLPLLVREGSRFYDLDVVYALLFDLENRQIAYGLRDILRVYLNYHHNEPLPQLDVQPTNLLPTPSSEQMAYLNKLRDFANEYIAYYRDGRNKGKLDEAKFRQHVLLPMRQDNFQISQWLNNVNENMAGEINKFSGQSFASAISPEELLYDYTGRYNPTFARFALEYLLNQFYHQLTLTPTTV